MIDFVCNYAPIRFMPFRETGEFINVGVVMCCPEIDWFDFRMELKKTKRAHGFFPELELTLYKRSLLTMELELARARNATELQLYGNRLDVNETSPRMLWFKDLIRPRESLVHFGEQGVMVTTDPRVALDEMFGVMVERQFARPAEHPEKQMTRRLSQLFAEWQLPYEKDKLVGKHEFRIKMPFVHFVKDKPVKVVKPFDLDKPDPREIYRLGDTWIAKLRRLKEQRSLPKDVVFVTRMPEGKPQRKAANAICKMLKSMKVRVVDFKNEKMVRAAVKMK